MMFKIHFIVRLRDREWCCANTRTVRINTHIPIHYTRLLYYDIIIAVRQKSYQCEYYGVSLQMFLRPIIMHYYYQIIYKYYFVRSSRVRVNFDTIHLL